MMNIQDYIAIAMQLRCEAINHLSSRAEAYDAMEACIDKIARHVFGAKKFVGPLVRLIVLPEYFLSSYPTRESIQEWIDKVCLKKDDPIFSKIGEIAIKNDVFISGNYYEHDPNFPDFYFQASFIIDNKGKYILHYRRLNSMYSVTPHDVLDRYVSLYGKDALFPVVDTELGRLACVASEEILYPEVSRCLMMRGAEVILHSTSEIGSKLQSRKNIAKKARAIENIAYVISANSAGINGGLVLDESTDGHSQIVHYEGHLLNEALTGESIVANATIHIDALRRHRQRVSMKNYIARQRFELYADSYKEHSFYPVNTFLDVNPNKSIFIKSQQSAIQQLKDKGIL